MAAARQALVNVNVSVLSTLGALAKSPMPNSWCSLRSRNRQSTTTPAAPAFFALVLINQPQQPLIEPFGCDTNTTLPDGIVSTKCIEEVDEISSDT
jgi:hypothetical protein